MSIKQGIVIACVLVVLVVSGAAFGAAVNDQQLIDCSSGSLNQNTQFYTCVEARTAARLTLEVVGAVMGLIVGFTGVALYTVNSQPNIETKPIVTV
jgi:hypothetical protein